MILNSGGAAGVAEEAFVRLLEELKQGLSPPPSDEQPAEEIMITAQSDKEGMEEDKRVDESRSEGGTAKSWTRFTFESNSDEQIKISVKSPDEDSGTSLEPDNAGILDDRVQAENDGSDSKYRMPTF